MTKKKVIKAEINLLNAWTLLFLLYNFILLFYIAKKWQHLISYANNDSSCINFNIIHFKEQVYNAKEVLFIDFEAYLVIRGCNMAYK